MPEHKEVHRVLPNITWNTNAGLNAMADIRRYLDTLPVGYVICDLDGTLCDTRHRDHYARSRQWDHFHECLDLDLSHPAVLILVTLLLDRGMPIVYLTGRPERYRQRTVQWLSNYHVWRTSTHLLMRPDDDHRSDVVSKFDLYHAFADAHEGWRPLFVLEDRDRVVAMWRGLGLTCFQVREGAY